MCQCDDAHGEPQFVAVTGGPGGGKTAILEMASRAFCSHVVILPEAASIVFGGGFPRIGTPLGRRAVQRAIFHVQRQLEELAREPTQSIALVLCDRGTVDGAAYWPGEASEYWEQVGTTQAIELAHYDAVIHLETPPIDKGYNHQNHLRTETAQEAALLDDAIREVWSQHPHRIAISSEARFMDKAMHALHTIELLLPPGCRPAHD